MTITRRRFLASSALVAGSSVLQAGFLHSVQARQEKGSPQGWEWVRSQFNLSDKYLHFAPFYLASHPKPVRDAIQRYAREIDANPLRRLEEGLFESEDHNMELRARTAAARYAGGRPEEYAIVPNTTTGLALICNGLSLGEADEILTTTHDHYSYHESIRLAAERVRAGIRKVPLYESGEDVSVASIVDRIRSAITDRTKVLGITWVHSSSGVRLPVREIASVVSEANSMRGEKNRLVLVVDGVHGLGAVDEQIDAMGCDFFVAGTHKWLMAPRGTGIIHGRPDSWGLVRPTIPTFSGLEVFTAWMEERKPAGPTQASWVTPGGFVAYEHQWAMAEAFAFHETIGKKKIAERIAELNGQLKEGLSRIPRVILHTPKDPALSAGIVAFDVEGLRPADVVQRLFGQGIIATESPYARSHVRLAAGIMHMPWEIDQAVKTVAAL